MKPEWGQFLMTQRGQFRMTFDIRQFTAFAVSRRFGRMARLGVPVDALG